MLTFGAQGAAGLIVGDRKRVLMQLRAPWVQYGGTWSIPGGAILPGESPEHGALRETREETGLRRRHLHLTDRSHVAEPVAGWTYTTVVAHLRKSARELGTPGPGPEATRHEWVPIKHVADRKLHPAFAASWPEVRPLLQEPVRVLFVCVGNVCRSPLAEVILRDLAARQGAALVVASVGVAAEVGAAMDSGSAACAARHDVDGSAHVARQITDADVENADVIVALAERVAPVLRSMARRLRVEPTILDRPAQNPWGMPPLMHESAYAEIAKTCREVLTLAVATVGDMPR